ncbi:hypothetical protein BDW22DRAFT_108698 [Trametopsis cervina]|nr:hypothetical protein BDW22DRAFT_108698 [Trametopsis cervina]
MLFEATCTRRHRPKILETSYAMLHAQRVTGCNRRALPHAGCTRRVAEASPLSTDRRHPDASRKPIYEPGKVRWRHLQPLSSRLGPAFILCSLLCSLVA